MEFLDIKFLDIFAILRGFLGTFFKSACIKFLDIFSAKILNFPFFARYGGFSYRKSYFFFENDEIEGWCRTPRTFFVFRRRMKQRMMEIFLKKKNF